MAGSHAPWASAGGRGAAAAGRGRGWRRLLAALLTLGSLLAPLARPALGAPPPGPAAEPGAGWTVMIYMAANNNLEQAARLNLAQIGGAAAQGVQVVVQAALPADDVPPSPVLNLPGWGGVKRLAAIPGGFRELADLGAADMTDPATLRDFIAWSRRAFPARRYALVLWDHGGAWRGYGLDASSPRQAPLSLSDLAWALGEGAVYFDLLGFDACLMASVEVALALQPYAGILVASEELEPGRGWDYTALVGALARRPDLTPGALARQVADGYLAQLQAKVPRQALHATLSVIDLTRMPAVAAALARFSGELRRYAEGGGEAAAVARLGQIFGQARRRAPAFGRLGVTDPGLSLDLGQFARQAAASTGDAGVAAAAGSLQAVLAAAVPYAVAGAGWQDTALSGLTIYVPALPDPERGYGAPGMQATGWPELVQRARAVAAQDRLPPAVAPPQLDRTVVVPGQTAAILRGEVTDETLVTGVMAGVVLLPAGADGGAPVLMAAADLPRTYAGTNPYAYTFDGSGWYLDDGGRRQPVFTVQWQPGRRAVFGRYRQGPRTPPVEAYFLYDEDSGRPVAGFEVTGGLLGALLPGAESRFQPYLYGVDLTPLPGGEFALPAATLTRGPLPAGVYLLTVTAFDAGDHAASNGALVVVQGAPGAGGGAPGFEGGAPATPGGAPGGEGNATGGEGGPAGGESRRGPGGRGCRPAGPALRPCPL